MDLRRGLLVGVKSFTYKVLFGDSRVFVHFNFFVCFVEIGK